jgi:hypothetical protein
LWQQFIIVTRILFFFQQVFLVTGNLLLLQEYVPVNFRKIPNKDFV